MWKYLKQVLIALDQFLNTLFKGYATRRFRRELIGCALSEAACGRSAS